MVRRKTERRGQQMPEDLVEFRTQERVQGGYRLEFDPKAGGGPGHKALITPLDPTNRSSWVRVAVSAIPDDLYLQVANLRAVPGDDDDLSQTCEMFITKFANKYGLLNGQPFLEPVMEWILIWIALGSALKALEGGDPNAMIAMTKIERTSSFAADLLGLKPKTTITGYSLIEGINHALEQAPLQAVVVSERPLILNQKIRPRNLKAFLWTQLLQAHAANDYAHCRVCGNWMSTVKGATRVRVTCSDACRTQRYLQTKGRAIELRQEGRTEKQIAEQLRVEMEWQPTDNPTEKIRSWTKGIKKEKR